MKKMTVAKFAEAGGVGVETVRYYQRRGLLPIPAAKNANYREYSPELVQQLLFIRKAQASGLRWKK